MKLQSVNVVPPSTHTVINDLTLSKALKHSGLCFGPGQSLESKPSPLFFLLLHTTQQVVIDEGRQRVAWELIENCPQICTWAKHLTCKCYSGSGCMAASERWEKTAEWKLDFALWILENRFNNKAEVFGSCGLEVLVVIPNLGCFWKRKIERCLRFLRGRLADSASLSSQLKSYLGKNSC